MALVARGETLGVPVILEQLHEYTGLQGHALAHMLELADEQYETLRQVAARDHETLEQLLGRMVVALATTQGLVYHTDEELLRALGADDKELAELAHLEAAGDADE